MTDLAPSARPTARFLVVGSALPLMALALSLLNESVAYATDTRSVATATSNATNGGGLLLALGAGVLLLGGIGFVVLTWSRRKRRPSQCAEQHAALDSAQQSVRYWEAALAHLRAVDSERALSGDGPETDASTPPGNVGQAEGSHADLMEKVQSGHAAALQLRDQCELDLIRCMASGVPPGPIGNPYHLTPEPMASPAEEVPPPRPDEFH